MTSTITITITISFFLLSLSLLSPTATSDIIDSTCKLTPLYDLCEATLRSTTPNTIVDTKGLATTMVNVLLGNTTDTLVYIESLIKQSRDPEEENGLAHCAELYRPVVKFNIPEAINGMSKGEFGFASYVVSDAAKQADQCEKGLLGLKDRPLGDRNKILHDLCDVAVAILKILVK